MVYTMMVTTVTHTTDAKFEKDVPAAFEEAEKLGLRHVLVIELEPRIDEQSDNAKSDFVVNHGGNGNDYYGDVAAINDSGLYPLFLKTLRQIIQADASTKDSSIDAIRIVNLSHWDCPSRNLVQALDGLQPRYLELDCGYEETCDLARFDVLQNPFPLQSLVITDACGVFLSSIFLPQIHTLHLNFPCAVSLESTGTPMALRNLVITENDAIDTFCRLSEETNAIDRLQSLKLSSTNGCDLTRYELEDFFRTLQSATSIRQLELRLQVYGNDSFDTLPLHLPHNLEVFVFNGVPNAIRNPDAWLDCTANLQWLPKLERFSLRLDIGVQVPASAGKGSADADDEGEDSNNSAQILVVGTEQLAHAIRSSLSSCRPEVEVLD